MTENDRACIICDALAGLSLAEMVSVLAMVLEDVAVSAHWDNRVSLAPNDSVIVADQSVS